MRVPQLPFGVSDIISAVEQGREAERERIIALLIEHGYIKPNRWESDEAFVALIKGEN